MNEETIKVFDYIGEKLGIAIDYTQENIQPYLEDLWHRFITYEIIMNSLQFVGSFIITLICLYFVLRFFKAKKKAYNGEIDNLFYEESANSHFNYIELSDLGVIIIIISCVLVLSFAISTIFQLTDLIELLFIPEKFILELVKTI